jgi:hypothetical protein|tara:strand:- start:1767 stop:2525 length:759 start_codon:yes stop_codon:yes gene_type:complete
MTFPTTDHAAAAQIVADYADRLDGVDTVLVVNSCARGQAVPESDLDMAILMTSSVDEAAMEADWRAFAASNATLQAFCTRSPFSAVHLDFFDGVFEPTVWDDGGGPDTFEIEIGNRVAYARPLHDTGPLFLQLQARWLPYYEEALRDSRLSMMATACLYDLDHVPFYVDRGLFLQAFDRLYKAFGEYIQALFTLNRTYPIAYNKWLAEQLAMIDRSDLCEPLLSVLSVADLSTGLSGKASALKELAVDLTAT